MEMQLALFKHSSICCMAKTATDSQVSQPLNIVATIHRVRASLNHGRLLEGGSVAEWLACWTRAQKGPGSNRSRDAVR